jgi:hypothetical protein
MPTTQTGNQSHGKDKHHFFITGDYHNITPFWNERIVKITPQGDTQRTFLKYCLIKESEDRNQNSNGVEIAQSVLLVEFVELVLLVNVMLTVLKEK